MASRSAKRACVYPGEETYNELGASSVSLNTALETYAVLRAWLNAPIPTQRAIITIVRQMLAASHAAKEGQSNDNYTGGGRS